jgi:hypothetical protein
MMTCRCGTEMTPAMMPKAKKPRFFCPHCDNVCLAKPHECPRCVAQHLGKTD